MSPPWMKFYPSDWRSDPALRSCSLAARGLWMEMLCLMHEASPRGHLLINGRPIMPRKVAALAGSSVKEVEACLEELEDAGVFSRDGETIISRRICRDEEKAAKDKANGKTGGNPILKPPDKPPDKGGVNPPDKAQKPEARSQIAAQQSSKGMERPKVELDGLEAELRKAACLESSPAPGLFDLSPILGLLDAGYRLGEHILPVLRSKAAAGKRGQSWKFYTEAIREAYLQREGLAAGAAPKSNGASGPSILPADENRWQDRFAEMRSGSPWHAQWGPRIGKPGCLAPPGLVEQHAAWCKARNIEVAA